ncbi:diguanylate cyclase (GGDEF)-like protein [Catenuloplanes nepalensis]|uniref:Diguanylate cyclase (GGDEF)-like protein n=1 Tax=Catenuloplanes nepalensis TaxID=587533 RepID=A0ABT9MW53_9ACTN|nr:EAL domain-containing protein [Catenuloplanes nepalensis]MDP9795655.1 diguanylate cyclase (GGDEF)-like protein [Catenuloplanes nepalensis]
MAQSGRRTLVPYLWLNLTLAVAAALWLAAHLTLVPDGPVAPGYAIGLCAIAITAVPLGRVGSFPDLSPDARRFWRGLRITAVLTTAGWAIAVVLIVLTPPPPGTAPRLPPLATGPIVAGVLAFLTVVLLLPLGTQSRAARLRYALDSTTAVLAGSMFVWHFVVEPLFLEDGPISDIALLAIAVACLLAGSVLTRLLLGGHSPVDRIAMYLVSGSGLLGAGAGFVTLTYGEQGKLGAAVLAVPVTALIMTGAAIRQAYAPDGSTPAREPGRVPFVVFPYVAVAAVNGLLLLVAHQDASADRQVRTVVAAAVATTGLVVLRQITVLRENTRLVAHLRAQEMRLQREATHDALTGLANRALFGSHLHAAVPGDDVPTVLLIDLDDFKTVNDTLGHAVGDRLLQAVAIALRQAAGDRGLPVRLGGDEFAVLLTGPAPAPSSAGLGDEVAKRLLAALDRPLLAGGHWLLAHVSIGAATARPGDRAEDVLRNADVAMYAAKIRGKARYVRYTDGMEQPVLAQMQTGGELRRALDENELVLFYQPIVDLESGRTIGVEALVRWRHPSRGLLLPGEFIPAAERTGLIVPLGRWALREACRQMIAWSAALGDAAPHKVGVNVSAHQLQDPSFPVEVTAALADSGLTADRLVLELTESAALRGTATTATLHALHDLGVKLALDDFGTGESSLSLLFAFPVAILKLDRSFVTGIELDTPAGLPDEARLAVPRAVQQMADALRLDTVAEGIENPAQALRLRQLGYTTAQGFHLSRPLAPEALAISLSRAAAPVGQQPA